MSKMACSGLDLTCLKIVGMVGMVFLNGCAKVWCKNRTTLQETNVTICNIRLKKLLISWLGGIYVNMMLYL